MTASTPKPPRFDPASFEEDIRLAWEKEHVYRTPELTDVKNKEYILAMFPYPSGAGLHTGHARIFGGTDVLARYFRMKGKTVLHPMGWDAFGLPAENAAIKLKRTPQDIVPGNIANFKNQYRLLGNSYDWEKEINTTDPKYYAITQWLFIHFFKNGLLYKKDTAVYYCPFCKTGLAQEEVQGDGTHERCGNVVERRNLPQWIFRIQEYADSLLAGLDGLDWPKGILEMQRNWIGKKEGIEITYPVVEADGAETGETITCFTTRPETNFGATFIVLAPEHPFVGKLLSGEVAIPDGASQKDIQTYVETTLQKTERERMADQKTKTGVFTGYCAANSLNGKKLPVYISDFVLVNVGTGAVVGVPAHDKRDYQFAATFNLEIKRVVEGPDGDRSEIENISQVQEEFGKMFDSEFLDTMDIHRATEEMMKYLEEKGMGKKVTSYHLRDWVFSRQRYWGEPIPMIFCQECADKKVSYWNPGAGKEETLGLKNKVSGKSFGELVDEIEDKMYGWFPLESSQLPLELPKVESYEPTDSGASPLSDVKEWVAVLCPHCDGQAQRETDTMPNWAGSCWYFLAFPQGGKLEELKEGIIFDKEVQSWMPIDWYVGGAEHAVLHLLYARFWMHALNDLGSITFREPFSRLRQVGMVQAEDGRKMSKSLGNVVNPDDVIKEYGADTLRVYEMFMAPFNMEIDWSTQNLQGPYRFVKRVWHIFKSPAKITNDEADASLELASELQTVIAKISADIPDVKFNTPIALLMEFLNRWESSSKPLAKNHAEAFLKLLAPFAPFITDHVWRTVFEHKASIHNESWPTADLSIVQAQPLRIPVQVNGKVRDMLVAVMGISQDEIVNEALKSAKIAEWIGGADYKVIYIKDKILNFVLTK
jgi:leucyl-tRNA synthetase